MHMIHRGVFDLFLSRDAQRSSSRVKMITVMLMQTMERRFNLEMMPVPIQIHTGRNKIIHAMNTL
jgi:hypothetical protein